MKKWMEWAGWMALAMLCCSGCAQHDREKSPDTVQSVEQEGTAQPSGISKEDEVSSPGVQLEENREKFFEGAREQGIDERLSQALYQRILDDALFEDGRMALTGLLIDDIDGNGQPDMLVMVLDGQERPFYGSGGLWFYMNEDAPYCFEEEDCSYYGWFDAFWADIDDDGDTEIVFSAQGTGCGAVGDSYKAVFKYRDHAIERMALPSDFEEGYDFGIKVNVFREAEPDSYSAYCDYFGEQIFFRGKSAGNEEALPSEQAVGGEVRGFYDLRAVEYEGKKMLQASEYLHGEGGIVHNVATAKFLITWEEDGTPVVARWWIEEDGDIQTDSGAQQ